MKRSGVRTMIIPGEMQHEKPYTEYKGMFWKGSAHNVSERKMDQTSVGNYYTTHTTLKGTLI